MLKKIAIGTGLFLLGLAIFAIIGNVFDHYAGLIASSIIVAGLTLWRAFSKSKG